MSLIRAKWHVNQWLGGTTESPSRSHNMRLRFSREFIALTLQFAPHVACIKLLPLDEALLRFTPLYLSFGLPRDFDPLHPLWQAFVVGLTPPQALVDWTYTFYLQQHTDVPVDVAERHPAFGCFFYAL